jgi:hypothetical protein
MNKLQRDLESNLIKHRDILINYLFDEEEKDKFLNNEKIKLPIIFSDILYYPNESQLRSFLNNNKNYKELFKCLLKIVKGEIKDDWIPPYGPNVYRCINPILFLLFYPDFKKAGFEYLITHETRTVNIYHKKIHIREQYSESFRLYYDLIDDKELKFIINDKYSFLYTGVKIEERILPKTVYCGRYVDMVYNLDDDNKVFIEINEKEHDIDEDYLRMRQIFARSLNKIVQYNTSKHLSLIKNELFKEFSKKFYKIDKKLAINLYMVKINKFDFELSKKFTQINLQLKNGGYEFEKFINMLEDWNFTKCNQIIKKMIKKDILKPFHFIDNIDPQTLLIDNKLVIKSDIKLNSVGVTKILQFPSSTDIWEKCDEITEAYSKFMDNYFLMIEDLLDNSTQELNLLYDEHNSVYDFTRAYMGVFAFGLENLSDICEEYSSFEHNEVLPFLIKDENSNIDIKDLRKKLNNDKLFDYFQKHTENKRVLYGWKYISESSLNDIIEKYKNDKNSHPIEEDLESDEEEL